MALKDIIISSFPQYCEKLQSGKQVSFRPIIVLEEKSLLLAKQSKDKINLDVSANDSLKAQFLYHGDCSYSLSETEGWEANGEPPQQDDYVKLLVMYEPNSSIKHSAPIGISSNVIFKDEFKDEFKGSIFNGFLKWQKETALDRGERVIEAKSIKTEDNKIALVRKYLIQSIGEYFAIAYIDEPEYIIMITFTTKATENMKERIFKWIGQESSRLNIGTFHSICHRRIRNKN